MCLYERVKCATYVSIIGGATQVSGISCVRNPCVYNWQCKLCQFQRINDVKVDSIVKLIWSKVYITNTTTNAITNVITNAFMNA